MDEIIEIEKVSDTDTDIETNNDNEAKLIIENDDFNEFEHVIITLVEVCDISPEEAVRVAVTVHMTGSCVAKSGTRDAMEAMCFAISLAGISARVE